MPDTLFLLGREVERLVNAPYAPSLQDLYSLVQQAPLAVVTWAAQKPCQVAALVDVLVDGLSRSRSALPLITSFARAQEFRDNLLQRYPYLLDQFLHQTIEGSEPGYLPLCIRLLSSPLPCDIIPPANLAVFVMQLIERMRANPCMDTVRPLFSISSCLQATGILSELPLEVMSCFQAELTNTLRNLEDHMGNLLCLATFARLVSSQNSSVDAEDGTNMPTWLQTIRHFFGPKRGLKTLDLVVLRVILACSSSYGNLTVEESAESVRLAISICDSVDGEQRTRWIEGNSIKLAKLLEKITRDGIDQGVQMLVLPTQIIPRLVKAHAACSGQAAIDNALEYVITSLSTSTTDKASFAKLQISRLVLQGLRFPNLQPAGIVSEQHCNAINNLTKSFPRQQPFASKCDGAVICYSSALRLENDLLCDLLAFWAEATLPRNTKEPSFSSGTAMLIDFLSRSKLLLPDSKCATSQIKPLETRSANPTLKIRETVDIPRNNWRNDMRDVMMANSKMLNDSIMQKVEDICYDLEQRCGNIEAPLKVAEEERTKYYLETEQLKEQNRGLETQLQQATSTNAELREEMSRLAGHAGSATDRVNELSTSLAQARHELEELQRTSQDALSIQRESFKTRELDLVASLTEREERLDELQEEIKCQTVANGELRVNLADTSKVRESLIGEIAAFKAEVSSLQTKLEENKASLTQKDESIKQLVVEKGRADELAKDLQHKLHEETSKAEILGAALQETTERFKSELEELQRQSEAQSLRIAEEAAERKSEVMSLQRIIHETKSDAAKELQTKEKRVQHLERKVQLLREERAAKAREFSEAQQHISRLMGVMGFKPLGPLDNRVSSRQRSRPSSEQPSPNTMQTQTDSGAVTFENRQDDPLGTSIEYATPRPNSCSPKRSRNHAFPSVLSSPSQSQESSEKQRKSLSQSTRKRLQERKPLGEVDHNSQHQHSTEITTCSRRESFNDSQFSCPPDQNHLGDIDLDLDMEFSRDFVFTSTSTSELDGFART
ncbi:hypothetical protein AN4791.2 [Aspergillus nidulans FGSC A4]|uniref:Uncharacterized protein n=1 Tax=Emericella nidulans (strain FGSC A4 / ATCC 38163 / CBS 112.46 / NRRL 194 / M139) TaxID=227321 RepID=Q5B3T9_EMENI|nr:hypothetical protein [Aspergillus nidulans FGSC A4]EAA60361.1 hypothetical protein AN4791.2 [Aspergillus nidulans FGSC A4]CBF76774.1 TPA: conserved hypothetical protein [Aspergillus nidulans FGSC A4]|eukprot:XP_662395.1 hypothetical protein AN4791.2 [Aspergillus nidulans FGSC A4]